jgi:diketogulonate reductase-like aldo/keto reductase
VFVVSKVYPYNASACGTVAACERSLARLGLDHLDGYLLHWRGSVPLQETVDAFENLRSRGLIRHWGVSNFDVADMEELIRVRGGERCATNQVYYSLSVRGPSFALVPWLQRHGMVTMAYSPIDQGALARNAALRALAKKRATTPAQLALAWLVAQPGVMAIPKAASEAHLRENLAALTLTLTPADHAALDAAFPPPRRKVPLAMV